MICVQKIVMFLLLFKRTILIIQSVIVFDVPDCSFIHPECIGCSGESTTDCVSCSYGFSLTVDGSCIGKKKYIPNLIMLCKCLLSITYQSVDGHKHFRHPEKSYLLLFCNFVYNVFQLAYITS